MGMMWGHFNSSIDDKGRMCVPAKIRSQLSIQTFKMTKGLEKCIWLYNPEEWKQISEELPKKASVYKVNLQNVVRKIISPAEDVNIDNSGRVKLSLSLMDLVGISQKNSCYVVGMGDRLEVWDVDVYKEFEEQHALEIKQTWADLGKSDQDT